LRSEVALRGGDLADDRQWITPQRLAGVGAGQDEVGREEYAVWVFPKPVLTRAIRFTHTARPADEHYAGWLGGVFLLGERLSNVAPQAVVTTSARPEAAAKINDQTNNGTWGAWDNGPQGGGAIVSAEHPVDVVLVWPQPVPLAGLAALWAGFAAADVQAFAGPPGRHPVEAPEADWHGVGHFGGIESQYPRALGVNWLDFGRVVTTRAVRLRITKATAETHPHLSGKTQGGKRVWLGELMAFRPLDGAPLTAAVLPAAAAGPQHPPIPIRFALDRPGVVTLVIEDAAGRRVRNLVSETPMPSGENVVWWDGLDDLGRDPDAARHGVYHIPARLVAPGAYRVRGLVHAGIELCYEFSVYNAGQPPWPTADHTGGWLANHTPPSSALFVPARRAPGGKPLVFLGSYVTEGGDGLAWVDLEGRKQGGVGWIGGAWTGAPYLAYDAGDKPAGDTYAYAASAWEGDLRLTALTPKGDRPVVRYAFPGGKEASAVTGLAVRDGLLVCSLPKQKGLLCVDARAGKVRNTLPLDDPRGLAFDAEGRLLVLAGRELRRYRLPATAAAVQLSSPETLVARGLEDPQQVALDSQGRLYVSDHGNSHQVKVFCASGKPLGAIGTPGVPRAGPYDENHMNHPNGLTVDSAGHLWVAETDYQPKRVSVWTLDGRLVRAFYGPAEYGGGGQLDPQDKTRFYFHGMEFRLDWATGRDRLERVFFRPEKGDSPQAQRGTVPFFLPDGFGVNGVPETALYVPSASGPPRRYFTNCYNSNPTNGASIACLWLDQGGIARPVAALGRANDWELLKGDGFKARWPAGVGLQGRSFSAPLVFLWSDLDGDGQLQPGEVSFLKAESGGITVMPDLSLVASRLNGETIRFPVRRFTVAGVPVYDLAAGETLARRVQGPTSSGGDQALWEPGGWTVLTVAPEPFAPQSICGVYRGQPAWSYPSPWPGLHASHESPPPDRPGELIGTTRLLGGFVTPRSGQAGPLWAVNGNMGNIYLFTADGLFVAELFHDIRRGTGWAMPIARRNMSLGGLSLHDENFWPSIAAAADGRIYLVDGARTSLVRIDGLEQIRRLPARPLSVTPEDLQRAAACLAESEARRQQAEGRTTLRVALRRTPPVVDGKLDDWAGADWVPIDRRGVAAFFDSRSTPYEISAALAVAGDRLYAAFRTGDPDLLKNSGETPRAAFKTGGGLDLCLGTDPAADPRRDRPVAGDVRLLVAIVGGKPQATLYRPVVPGTKEPVPFSSPWRTIHIDRVDDVSDQVRLAGADGNYEISIPLAVLGLKPEPGRSIRGDVGVLRGNGFQTLQRVYWSNKATAITSDVPSEAQLEPRLWGRWVFQAE
jgi:hypothetical protein